jgi:hypothetical protein
MSNREISDLQPSNESHPFQIYDFVIRALGAIANWYHNPRSGHVIFLFLQKCFENDSYAPESRHSLEYDADRLLMTQSSPWLTPNYVPR